MVPQSNVVPAPRPASRDLWWLGVAVVAVSTSAPLIQGADAPALAVAAWRNVLSLPVLGLFVLLRADRRGAWGARSSRDRWLSRGAGVFLAAHFATWIPSLSYTSVASSVALVATQPVWAALIARWRGQPVGGRTALGIGVAFAGIVVLTGADLSVSSAALFGDGLAMLGGMFAAAYVTVGAEVRRHVTTAVYALSCYGVASLVLLVLCISTDQAMTGYDRETWLAIGGLVVGAQLLGHTLVNLVLRTLSPALVSVAILFEILGATGIAYLAFGEVPPAAVWPAAVLIVAGVVVVVRSRDDANIAIESGGILT